MSGVAGPLPWEPLLRRSAPDPLTPLLVTGLAAAAILRADGELVCPRETRGGLVEWGGAYAQGVRLTGPWTVGGSVDGEPFDLASTLTELTAHRWSVGTTHRWGAVEVRQEVTPLLEEPGVERSLTFRADRPSRIRVSQRLSPFLAPVLVEGIRPYEYRLARRASGVDVRAYGWGMVLSSSLAPTGWTVDGDVWGGESISGHVQGIEMIHEMEVGPAPTTLRTFVWGGLTRTIDHRPDPSATGGVDRGAGAAASEAAWSDWRSRTPSMELPNAPEIARAYDLARSAIRGLYTRPDDEITGLVAGFPWYPALWCRDLAWMLPAVLWLGDREWAEASLRTAFKFQATAPIPILAAETGEIPMQISAGPAFLYGTSDTTLHYPTLVRRLLDHGAAPTTGSELWPHLRAAADWAHAKTDPASGLLTHGGEVGAIRKATAQIGSIHYGMDALDTTIWDSTDRRAHAIDVQVLFLRALRSLGEVGGRIGELEHAADDARAADRLAAAVAARYGWPAQSYLYDSIHRDGTPEPKLRPNALLAVSDAVVPLEVAKGIVARASRDDMTTPWGVRTLSTTDPHYNATLYHEGQVWTIATAWAADAAWAVGERDLGFRYLATIADRILAENGLANECYRGDRPEAFDSCFLLGFSVGPFLTVLFERLWGLSVRADLRELRVRPAFPTAWRSARLRHLRVGEGFVDLDWTPAALSVTWTGPGALTVVSGSARLTFEGPATGSVDPASP